MNKYYFIISKITHSGLVKKKVGIIHSNKFKALNILREIYPEDEYVSCLIEIKVCDS